MAKGSLLRELDIFNGLTDEQLEKVGAICQEASLGGGEIILHESAQSKEMYIIVKGEVEIMIGVNSTVYPTPATNKTPGDELPLERPVANKTACPIPAANGQVMIVRLGEGQIFGEMALVDQGLRSATVRCSATPTHLLIIQRDDFMALSQEDSRLGFIVMRNIAADVCFKLRSHNLAWK